MVAKTAKPTIMVAWENTQPNPPPQAAGPGTHRAGPAAGEGPNPPVAQAARSGRRPNIRRRLERRRSLAPRQHVRRERGCVVNDRPYVRRPSPAPPSPDVESTSAGVHCFRWTKRCGEPRRFAPPPPRRGPSSLATPSRKGVSLEPPSWRTLYSYTWMGYPTLVSEMPQPLGSQVWQSAGCRKYEAAAAENLVRGVLLDMESGDLPLDPMMLSIDLSELTIDRPHFTEPSRQLTEKAGRRLPPPPGPHLDTSSGEKHERRNRRHRRGSGPSARDLGFVSEYTRWADRWLEGLDRSRDSAHVAVARVRQWINFAGDSWASRCAWNAAAAAEELARP